MKVAKLVTFSIMTRVLVDEYATEDDIKQAAIEHVDTEDIYDNIESIEDDTECPYDPEND